MGVHDQNFKNLILDYLRPSVEFFAKSESSHFAPDMTITPLREEQVKEWLGERGAIMDVPLIVEWPNGEQAGLVFCFEHNSLELKHLIKRHALYCIKISMLYDTDRVVPVAIFPEAEGEVKDSFEFSGSADSYLKFKCLTVKLKELQAQDFLKSENIVARLCLPLMDFDTADKFEVIASAYDGLNALESDREKRRKYIEFIDCYAAITDEEFELYRERCIEHNPMKEDIMTIAQVLHNRGLKEGEAKMVVKLFRAGTISEKQARAELEQLVADGKLSQRSVEELLAQPVAK